VLAGIRKVVHYGFDKMGLSILLAALGILSAVQAKDSAVAVTRQEAVDPQPQEEQRHPRKAQEFKLEDQFRKIHHVTFPRTKPTVLIFADRRSARRAEKWVSPLYDRYKERIIIEGGGVGKSVPRWERSVIRFLLRKITPYPILLDWKGDVGRLYEFRYKHANVYIIEPGGAIALQIVGKATPERIEQAFTALDALVDT